MKTLISALFASVALAVPVQAGSPGHFGGVSARPMGFDGGGHTASRGNGARPVFRGRPMQNFGGGRMYYPGQRFSGVRAYSPAGGGFRRPYVVNSNSTETTRFGPGQITSGNIGRDNRTAQFSNPNNRSTVNVRRNGIGASQAQNGNHLRPNWRSHVVAQHSADWHRDWDRGHDHWWHGHHCRFINGSWVIFDSGFDPWWPYGYPYGAYAYDGYPYDYDSDDYDQGVYQGEEYNANTYGSNDQNDQDADSTVAVAQQQLARQGYFRGEIDGVFGPETRRALTRYQNDHGLRVTGSLTTDTLRTLGLQGVANN